MITKDKSRVDTTYKEGSIIEFKNDTLHSISIVEEVDPPYVWCSHTICKVRQGRWKHMRDIDPEHNAELIELVSLIGGEEFDIIIDTKLIPREVLVDVS